MAISILDRANALTQANQIKPTVNEFDETKGVAGRVNSITSQDGPLMQLAATRAKQSANALGMRNSSLAVGAGQKAVLDAATPLASADASLYQQQGLANQSAQNTAATANSTNAITAGMRGAELDQNNDQFGKTLGENARQFNVSSGNQVDQYGRTLAENSRQFDATTGLSGRQLSLQEKAQADGLKMEQTKVDAQIAQFAQQLGISQQELGLKRDSLSQEQQQFLAGLEQKKAELGQQASQFGQTIGLQTRAQGASEAQAAQQQALQVAQLDAQKDQFAKQLGMSAQELDLKRDSLSVQDRQFLQGLDQQKAQLAQQGQQFQQTQASQLKMFDDELGQKAKQFGLTQQQQTALANLDKDTKLQMATIEAQFKGGIQNSANISNAWGSMMTQIGNVQNNPDLESGAKTTLINNTIGAFKGFATFWNRAAGIDVSALLNFSAGDVPPGGGAAPATPPAAPPARGDPRPGGVAPGTPGYSYFDQP